MKNREPWNFCETPKEKCTMNYCDENGCQNRKRNYVQGNDLIADVSNSGSDEYYQVYLNGNWIADCMSYEEAETIANREAMNGRINIERI